MTSSFTSSQTWTVWWLDKKLIICFGSVTRRQHQLVAIATPHRKPGFVRLDGRQEFYETSRNLKYLQERPHADASSAVWCLYSRCLLAKMPQDPPNGALHPMRSTSQLSSFPFTHWVSPCKLHAFSRLVKTPSIARLILWQSNMARWQIPHEFSWMSHYFFNNKMFHYQRIL